MPRFFVAPENINENYVIISGEDFVHISRVLRMKIGEPLVVCDFQGNDYYGEVQEFNEIGVKLKINSKLRCEAEPEVKVSIYQGLPKGDKMEYIIQKCVELGINDIIPMNTARAIVKIGDKKSEEKKLLRWNRIAYEAAKQSGRGIVPIVRPVANFKSAVKSASESDIAFVPYEKAFSTKNGDLSTLLSNIKVQGSSLHISFLIGPEGGFEEDEISFCKENNITPISLGKRILRTETAGSAFLAIIMHELGEMN